MRKLCRTVTCHYGAPTPLNATLQMNILVLSGFECFSGARVFTFQAVRISAICNCSLTNPVPNANCDDTKQNAKTNALREIHMYPMLRRLNVARRRPSFTRRSADRKNFQGSCDPVPFVLFFAKYGGSCACFVQRSALSDNNFIPKC